MSAEEKSSDDTNQLWVHLSGLADGNIFAIYPRILEEIFRQEEQVREDDQRQELESMVLPSDMEFRLKIYFRLVEKQRAMDDQPTEAEISALDKLRSARRWSRADSATDPWAALIQADGPRRHGPQPPAPTPSPSPGPTIAPTAPAWGPRELAKAARLLERPPLPVAFDDDHEMRRVYSLIYDVFRYKSILEEALNDVGFYCLCSEAQNHKNIAWLLLLDQQRRRWAKRDSNKSSYMSVQQSGSTSHRKFSSSSVVSNSSTDTGDSATSYKTSRKSSLESKEAFFPRNLIKSKVRAVRELSQETVEAIRRARQNTLEIKSIPETSVPAEELKKNVSKAGLSARTFPDIHRISEELLEKDITFQTNECADIVENAKNIVKKDAVEVGDASDASNTPVQNVSESSVALLGRSGRCLSGDLSRADVQNIMAEVAGEVGAVLKTMDESLWEHRVRISAAIAKIRIRNQALTLSEMLPPHLRDERVSATLERDTVTGWVNVFKSRNISDLLQRLNEMGLSFSSTPLLEKNQFHLDKFCPKFVSLRPPRRSSFVSSTLVTDSIIVLQEREFCLGAAALCRALRAAQLRGDVVQTHGTSPRAAAYLASQLRDQGPDAGGLLVFGAGDRKPEYEGVLRSLGVTNARVFSEGAGEAGRSLWAGAVAALAAPPNSYSAVLDPIDLVCSRGGDLGMLEVLTESEISMQGKLRVMKILEEQKKILRLCMSKPQIQIIVYETHSVLSAENGEMVKRAVAEANRAVRELHALRKQRAREALPRAPKCAVMATVQETPDDEVPCEGEPDEVDLILANERGRRRSDKDTDLSLAAGVVSEDAASKKKSIKTKQDAKERGDKRTRESEDKSAKPKKSTKMSDENKAKEKESPKKQKQSKDKKAAKGAEDKGDKGKSQRTEDVYSTEDKSRTLDSSRTDYSSTDQLESGPIDPDSEFADVKVPHCDLFEEQVPLPLAGLTFKEREGCYLALIQRKEIIRLNAMYMIKMAEARGLFGGNSPAPRRPAVTRIKAPKEEKDNLVTKKLSQSQIDRIAAPTHAWSTRVGGCRSPAGHEGGEGCPGCPACARHHAPPGPRARQWWRLAAAAGRGALPLRLPRRRARLAPLSLSVTAPLLDVEGPDSGLARLIEGVAGMST